MANWCITEYTFTGDKQSLEEIHAFMQRLEGNENGMVTGSLVKLAEALDKEPNLVQCRGYWEDLSLNKNTLTFTVWTAWTPAYQLMFTLKNKFPDVEYFYYAEECGNGLYETNDAEGRFYPERYKVEYIDSEDDVHEAKFIEYKDAEEWIKQTADHNVLNDADRFVEKLKTDNPDIDRYIHPIEVMTPDQEVELIFDTDGKGTIINSVGTTIGTVTVNLNN